MSDNKHKQYQIPQRVFDAFNKESPVQQALGSNRNKVRQEAADIRSTNFVPGVSGWRLTPSGIEFGSPVDIFPVVDSASINLTLSASGLTAVTIGMDTEILGADGYLYLVRSGLVVSRTLPSVSPSVSPSPSLSPSFSPSKSPSLSPSTSPSLSPSVSPSVSPS